MYPGEGSDEIVKKDRRGELFYYMHHQVLARYNADRMANGLERIKPVSLEEPIEEAYFPKIIRSKSQRAYASRIANCTLHDIKRKEAEVEVNDLRRWRDRIYEAVDSGFITDVRNILCFIHKLYKNLLKVSGNRIPFDEVKGIDVLGNLVESTRLSINRKLYGNLHGLGHDLISFIHDPDGKYLEDISTMGSVATAMRDPVFYRWHLFINNIFLRYKATQPEYPREELEFDEVEIKAVTVQVRNQSVNPNTLMTYWQKSEVDLGVGVDFGNEGNFFGTFKHLQHAPFFYSVVVANSNRTVVQGTCRIFIAPKLNEKGRQLKFEEQRILMIEMDKFTVVCEFIFLLMIE